MENTQVINTTIPLWGLLTMVGTVVATSAWTLITLYFENKAMKKTCDEMEAAISELESNLDTYKIQAKSELDNHKKDTNLEFARVNTKLDAQNNILVEIKTIVQLLMKDQIKH